MATSDTQSILDYLNANEPFGLSSRISIRTAGSGAAQLPSPTVGDAASTHIAAEAAGELNDLGTGLWSEGGLWLAVLVDKCTAQRRNRLTFQLPHEKGGVEKQQDSEADLTRSRGHDIP